ncbi:ribonuclease P protein component [Candidatus Parcubacteria bacterium]|nr:ribonuclease P protein component [Candidatus Parcubacteria bacterium]
MALPKQYRLKKRKDFDLVFKKGKAFRGSILFVKAVSNNLPYARFAPVVSLKVAKKAVDRNVLRRLLSSVSERYKDRLKGLDIVVMVTHPEALLHKKEVEKEYEGLLKNISK